MEQIDLPVGTSCMDCPYLPDRQATLAYSVPLDFDVRAAFDRRLERGQRRHGKLVYEPKCEGCRECISLRLPVESFEPSRSQRRVWLRGRDQFQVQIQRPLLNGERLRLLNRHSQWRKWTIPEESLGPEFYQEVLIWSLYESWEIAYYHEGKLVGIAICDQGEKALSAVYTFYDPDVARLSPGTYSILYQIDWCRRQNLEFLYLGYFVAGCASLEYKARFHPHQRRIGGIWVDHYLQKSSGAIDGLLGADTDWKCDIKPWP